MEAEAAIERLLEADVLVESDGQLRLTDAFDASVERHETETEDTTDATVEVALREMTGRDDLDVDLVDVTAGDRLFVGYFEALREFDFDVESGERLATLTTIDYARRGEPPTRGVPDGFLPVRGDVLPPLLRFSRWAIVYIWRDECPPCRAMRKELSRAVDSDAEGLARFAVFGPNWSEFLEERFDTVGGPTTLLMLDGAVDLRLLGAHPADEIERETETLLEL